jgi:hypothetical protein
VVGAVGQLTRARLRHRPGRWVLLAVGVALALALPVLSAATGRLVAAQTLSHAIQALPVGERTVIASYGGTADPSAQRHDDQLVRNGLAALSARPVGHRMLFGELADATGTTYRLGATDDLAHEVRLTSGRLPTSCAPQRCEVLLTGATTSPALAPALGIVVVGTGERTDPLLLPGTFDPGPATRVLLGADPDALQRLSSLEQFPRGSGWVASLDPERITSLGVPGYADLSRRVSDSLALRIRALVLSVPDDALLREDARATASQSRFALLGGTTSVLVLGFVLVAAVGLRREHLEVASLLRRRGASTRDVLTFALLGAGVAVVVGAVLGATLGWIGAFVAAQAEPLHPPAAALATGSVVDAVPTLLVLAVAAVALTAAVLAWPDSRSGSAWHVVDLLVVATIATAVLVAARGAVGAASVGGDPLAIALPVLTLTAAALVAARLWVPVAALVSRRLPRPAVAARLAASSGVSRPLRTVVTVGFVTAAVGAVVFAGAYRATLQAGSADTAAFDVPADARISTGAQGADPVALLAQQPLPGPAYAVLRTVAGVRTSATSGDAVQVLGIDAGALRLVSRWDRTVGASSPDTVSAELAEGTPAPGIALPAGATELALPVVSWSRTTQGLVDVTAWVTAPEGREGGVALLERDGALRCALPDLGAGTTLTALTLRENSAAATRRQHRLGEGGTTSSFLSGRLVLATPAGATASWSSWSSRTADVAAAPTRLIVAYQLAGPLVVVRPGLVDRSPVRILTDDETASRGTSLRLDLGAGDAVAALVVGTLPRFPTTGPRFLVADRAALAAALDDHEPGTGAPQEIWAGDGGSPEALARALAAAPWDQGRVETQAASRAALESDAVGQGAARLLLIAAAIALLVAIVSLVLLVTGERRDDAGQLLAHEADGVATSTLRRSIWWRAVVAAAPALVVGTAAGLVLSRSVSTLVALSASGTTPTPPLLPSVGAGMTAIVLLVGLAVALAACAVATSRMLRAAWPSGADQDLR